MTITESEWNKTDVQPNIITFIGTTPNIGTTITALQHSFHIAQFTMCKVLFVCFNFKSSKLHQYFGLSKPYTTLDDIIPHLKNKKLTQDSFQQLLFKPHHKREVYILLGNSQRELAEQYLEDDLNYLVELARKQFDYIVIDTSSYWDNAGSFVALTLANHIVVTTTDARSHFQEDYQKWFGALSPHLSLTSEQLYLLVLRQSSSDQHYKYKDIILETMTTPYADTTFPTTIYGYLDRGQLLEWLLHSHEAQLWLSEHCHLLLNPAHLSLLPPAQSIVTKFYWPWHKKQKSIVTINQGG